MTPEDVIKSSGRAQIKTGSFAGYSGDVMNCRVDDALMRLDTKPDGEPAANATMGYWPHGALRLLPREEEKVGPAEAIATGGQEIAEPVGIDATLAERGARYGAFIHHAVIAQDLQDAMRRASGWGNLAADQKQALSVITDKIARMLNGDPDYLDNWHDIIGYAKLVEDRLRGEQQ